MNPPLFKLKVLEALKNSDYDQLVRLVNSIKKSVNYKELLSVKNLIINLAVQVAPLKLVVELLSEETSRELSFDINSQDQDGNTPLHLAALNSRLDVAQILMRDARINDTILNNELKQPIEVAKDLEMVTLLQYERANYVERTANELRQSFTSHNYAKLEEIMSSARNSELLDINGNDTQTGLTVLQEFILKDDIEMVKWILNHGGDPFKRDLKGRLPIDLIPKTNEPMKQLVTEACKDQTVMTTQRTTGVLQPPTYKGYLRKWTNFASGYKLRWFILDSDGILSYYKSQDDTNNACRGSLNMKNCTLHLDSSEALKFEIIGNDDVRWHLKGNHPVETNRWVWSLQGAIRASKDRERASAKMKQHMSKLSFDYNINNSTTNTNVVMNNKFPKRKSSMSSMFSKNNGSNGSNEQSPAMNRRESEIVNDSSDDDDNEDSPKTTHKNVKKDINDNSNIEGDEDDDSEDELGDGNLSYNKDEENIDVDSGPFSQEIQVLKRGFSLELTSLKELLITLATSENSSLTKELQTCLISVNSISENFDNLNELISKRDQKLVKTLKKQKDINELWISSIRDLENELEQKNIEIQSFENERKVLKKALTKKFNSASAVSLGQTLDETVEEVGENEENEESFISNKSLKKKSSIASIEDAEISKFLNEDDDEDDEFFDADDFSDEGEYEEGEAEITEQKIQQLNNLSLTTTLTNDKNVENEIENELNDIQKQKYLQIIEDESYNGYNPETMRTDLPLKIDERPQVSLWAVLKSMIGKDITKISLPVSFNEPTSLLQRVAEDIEYSYLLDQAATFEDSTLRMLYIGAFATAEYSSTIDRVAKPFNPLLGETFEYCRPDKGTRFFVEQVSHHPPISALWTESAKWDYYGETSVKSGFNGRSFDVQPTATWYLHMRPDGSDNVEEIYTWKKVTTSVVGIIMGNPSIDNWGEMEITNHRTGDRCVINMKPRGWRGTATYELSGIVYNSEGEKAWAIGGHWNSKIFGKKIVNKNEAPMALVDSNTTATTTANTNATGSSGKNHPTDDGSKFLIWQVTPRPAVLFNLTSYAITLNDLSKELEPWVKKSDCRFRKDQRAMEEGRYEEAAVLKHEVEEKQRAARKYREANGIEYKPCYFVKKPHPLTNEDYFEFTGAYWKERKHRKFDEIDIF